MPRPGPVKISPPSLGAWRSANCSRHHPAVCTKPMPEATPAKARAARHNHGAGQAIAASSAAVVSKAVSISAGLSARTRPWPWRRSSQGSAMHSSAPSK